MQSKVVKKRGCPKGPPPDAVPSKAVLPQGAAATLSYHSSADTLSVWVQGRKEGWFCTHCV